MEDGKKKKTLVEQDQEGTQELVNALGLEKIDPLKLVFYWHLTQGKIRPKDMLEGLAIRCQEYDGDYLAIADVIYAVTIECGTDYLEEWLGWLEKPFYHHTICNIDLKAYTDEFVLGYLIGIFRSLTWADKTSWADHNDIIDLLTRRLKALPTFFLAKNAITKRFEKNGLPTKFKDLFQLEVDAFIQGDVPGGIMSGRKANLVKQLADLSKKIWIKLHVNQEELSEIGKFIIKRLYYAYAGGHNEIGLMHLISDQKQ